MSAKSVKCYDWLTVGDYRTKIPLSFWLTERRMRIVKFSLFLLGAMLSVAGAEYAQYLLWLHYRFNTDRGVTADVIIFLIAVGLFTILINTSKTPKTSSDLIRFGLFCGAALLGLSIIGTGFITAFTLYVGKDLFFAFLLAGEQLLLSLFYVLLFWALASLFVKDPISPAKA